MTVERALKLTRGFAAGQALRQKRVYIQALRQKRVYIQALRQKRDRKTATGPCPDLVIDAGWSSPVARQAHNLEVVGSNPTPATKIYAVNTMG